MVDKHLAFIYDLEEHMIDSGKSGASKFFINNIVMLESMTLKLILSDSASQNTSGEPYFYKSLAHRLDSIGQKHAFLGHF